MEFFLFIFLKTKKTPQLIFARGNAKVKLLLFNLITRQVT